MNEIEKGLFQVEFSYKFFFNAICEAVNLDPVEVINDRRYWFIKSTTEIIQTYSAISFLKKYPANKYSLVESRKVSKFGQNYASFSLNDQANAFFVHFAFRLYLLSIWDKEVQEKDHYIYNRLRTSKILLKFFKKLQKNITSSRLNRDQNDLEPSEKMITNNFNRYYYKWFPFLEKLPRYPNGLVKFKTIESLIINQKFHDLILNKEKKIRRCGVDVLSFGSYRNNLGNHLYLLSFETNETLISFIRHGFPQAITKKGEELLNVDYFDMIGDAIEGKYKNNVIVKTDIVKKNSMVKDAYRAIGGFENIKKRISKRK